MKRSTLGLFKLMLIAILILCSFHNYAQDIKLKPALNQQDKLIIQIPGQQDTQIVKINGEKTSLNFSNGEAIVPMNVDHRGSLKYIKYSSDDYNAMSLYHISKNKDDSYRIRHLPLWLSIIPPMIAIILALIFKEVIISLFIGIWSGAFIAGGMRIESLYYIIASLFSVVAEYIVEALTDSGHISVIVFSLLIGGMVAIISKNGGMAGVVKALSRYARSPKSAQFITWLLGIAIFFDDYANTLIVGNTMRSVTDRFKVSREKLAYIVDSTAAPVASVAFITTWIGAELGYIDSGISMIEGWDPNLTPYTMFISSLKYSFYPLFALVLMLFLILMKRDFGPMRKAELRARTTGQVSPARTEDEDEPDMENLDPVKGAVPKWYNAVVPIIVVISMTIFGLLTTGLESLHSDIIAANGSYISNSWSNIWSQMDILFEQTPGLFQKVGRIIGASDSYVALLWASLSGVIVAIIMTLASRIMNLINVMFHMTTGFKTMLPAVIILTLAWSLAITTEQLQTADYLASVLQGNLNPLFLPAVIFVLSAVIAFSTGSSWSTMAILYPIAIPTTWYLCQDAGIDYDHSVELLFNVIATILAASVLGDHCSPISDTTILSSLASDCNHLDHVKTQFPYAITAGVLALIAVFLSTFLGAESWHSYVLAILGIGVLYLIVRYVGKPTEIQAEHHE